VSSLPATYWADKAAVVTGAAHGIGKTVARHLLELGGSVALVDVDGAALEAARESLDDWRERVLAIRCDVSDRAQVDDMAQAVDTSLGGVHFLVNCAYTNWQVRVLDITEAHWQRVMGVNLAGTLFVGQAIARSMVDRGIPGRIVNLTSGAARVARPGFAAYGCSKAAVSHLTRYMAVELAEHGILVNAVNPGLTASEWVSEYELDPAHAAEHEYKMARIPLGRMGEREEAAAVVIFLLGPEASFLTGGTVVSDGGVAAGLPLG
jgi:NAD(P)-dependent dehydrogenase (short-subunit alcohol dehydrogenase family)